MQVEIALIPAMVFFVLFGVNHWLFHYSGVPSTDESLSGSPNKELEITGKELDSSVSP
eukprot:gene13997-15460_t